MAYGIKVTLFVKTDSSHSGTFFRCVKMANPARALLDTNLEEIKQREEFNH
ncbi:hypothetical protein ES703_28982 [subsurface metagenome]